MANEIQLPDYNKISAGLRKLYDEEDRVHAENVEVYIKNGLEYVSNFPFVHHRDNRGNIVLYNDVDENQQLLIESNKYEYTNESALRTLDYQFRYFKFPAVVTRQPIEIGDVNIDIELNTNLDRYEGSLLRSSRGIFYIENGVARPFRVKAATNIWLEKRNLPTFTKTSEQQKIPSDVDDVLSLYDVGEPIPAVFNDVSYTNVSNLIIDSYEPGLPYTAVEAVPTNRVCAVRVSFIVKPGNGLIADMGRNGNTTFEIKGSDDSVDANITLPGRLGEDADGNVAIIPVRYTQNEDGNYVITRDIYFNLEDIDIENDVIQLSVKDFDVALDGNNFRVEASVNGEALLVRKQDLRNTGGTVERDAYGTLGKIGIISAGAVLGPVTAYRATGAAVAEATRTVTEEVTPQTRTVNEVIFDISVKRLFDKFKTISPNKFEEDGLPKHGEIFFADDGMEFVFEKLQGSDAGLGQGVVNAALSGNLSTSQIVNGLINLIRVGDQASIQSVLTELRNTPELQPILFNAIRTEFPNSATRLIRIIERQL